MRKSLSYHKILKIAMVDVKIINRTFRLAVVIPIMSVMFIYLFKDSASLFTLPFILSISLSFNFCTMFNRKGDEFKFYKISPVTSREFVVGKNIGAISSNLTCAILILLIACTFSGKTPRYTFISLLLIIFIFISTLSTGNMVSMMSLKHGTNNRYLIGYLLISLTAAVCSALFSILNEFTNYISNFMICISAAIIYYFVLLIRTTANLEKIMQ
jgi:hypothetical protein